MLLLSRYPGGRIYVQDKEGNRLEILVKDVDGRRVRLGFEDPNRNFEIVRDNAKRKEA